MEKFVIKHLVSNLYYHSTNNDVYLTLTYMKPFATVSLSKDEVDRTCARLEDLFDGQFVVVPLTVVEGLQNG